MTEAMLLWGHLESPHQKEAKFKLRPKEYNKRAIYAKIWGQYFWCRVSRKDKNSELDEDEKKVIVGSNMEEAKEVSRDLGFKGPDKVCGAYRTRCRVKSREMTLPDVCLI